MSLLRLLTAGKSLVGLKEPGQYHLASRGLLPEFGGKKNPFRTTTRLEPAQKAGEGESRRGAAAKTGASVEPPRSDERRESQPVSLSPIGGTAAKNVCAAAARANSEQEAPAPKQAAPEGAARAAKSGRLGRWTSRMTGWLWHPQPKPAKSAIPHFTKPPLQGELSLESVKVVRNDLSDSDLEIVPAKAPAAPTQARSVRRPAAPAEPAAPTRWRVSTRLFGAGKP